MTPVVWKGFHTLLYMQDWKEKKKADQDNINEDLGSLELTLMGAVDLAYCRRK